MFDYVAYDNPPLEVVLASLPISEDTREFVEMQTDKSIKAQLVNYLRRDPDAQLEELRAFAETIPGQKTPEPTYAEIIYVEAVEANRLAHAADTLEFQEWLSRELIRARIRGSRQIAEDGKNVVYRYQISEMADDPTGFSLTDETGQGFGALLDGLVDWIVDVSPNYKSMTLDQALRASSAWHEACSLRGEGEDYEEKNLVHAFRDGWSVQEIRTENDLEVEGNRMGHCVGSYFDDVESGRSRIFSLRDPMNQPHVTFETKRNTSDMTNLWADAADTATTEIVQIQGKGNDEPIPAYRARLVDFFKQDGKFYMSRYMVETDKIAERIILWQTGKQGLGDFDPGYGLKIPWDDSLMEDVYSGLSEEALSNAEFAEALTGDPPPPWKEDMTPEEREAQSAYDEMISEGLSTTMEEFMYLMRPERDRY